METTGSYRLPLAFLATRTLGGPLAIPPNQGLSGGGDRDRTGYLLHAIRSRAVRPCPYTYSELHFCPADDRRQPPRSEPVAANLAGRTRNCCAPLCHARQTSDRQILLRTHLIRRTIFRTQFANKFRWTETGKSADRIGREETSYERVLLPRRASSEATALIIRSPTSAATFTWSALNWPDG